LWKRFGSSLVVTFCRLVNSRNKVGPFNDLHSTRQSNSTQLQPNSQRDIDTKTRIHTQKNRDECRHFQQWRETYRTHAQCGAKSIGGLPYIAKPGKTRQLTCISTYTPDSAECCGRAQLHWLLHWLQHGQRPPPQAPLRRWCWPCRPWPLLRAQWGTLFFLPFMFVV